MTKTLIIGGVAGGASAAARLRRLNEEMEIVILEKGDYISYANCGLPYYIGDVIKEREKLLVTPAETMRSRFRVDVRTRNEAIEIDRENRIVSVRREDGSVYEENYDELILATGSSPLKPRIPGIDTEGIYTLWSVNDTDRIRKKVDEEQPKTAAVIGGGFIGLEMAENLNHRGIHVSIIEAQNQVMAPLDYEMAQVLHRNIMACGTALYLGDGVKSFEKDGGQVKVILQSGREVKADMVLLSIGVRPNGMLAKEAGLNTNERGGIIVDDHMLTSDEHIWAVGDVIEIKNFVTGDKGMIPLAGPANKQGRICANNIAARYNEAYTDLESVYNGTQGTSVAKVYDNTAATVGVNEKLLKAKGKMKDLDYRVILIAQKSHAGYYPMASDLYIKLILDMEGKILGAQIVGADGVDKRIDVLATVMRLGGNAKDLEELELAYAPPYSSAKDPVNMAGFCAGNVTRGMMKFRLPDEMDEMIEQNEAVILDIREDIEYQVWHMENSIHIPLGKLRERIGELDHLKEDPREICVLCAGGVRAHNGSRILQGHGFKNVSIAAGGANFYRLVKETSEKDNPDFNETPPVQEESCGCRVNTDGAVNLDCSGLQCPGPIMKVNERIQSLQDGDVLRVSATDMGFARDVEGWCQRTGNTFVSSEKNGQEYVVTLQKGREAVKDEMTGTLIKDLPQGKTMVVFDGDFDKALAAFIIANGAAAMGRPVTMFFTFWGLNILRKREHVKVDKTAIEKMFGKMMPQGTAKLALSKMNMFGLGTKMMKMIMKQKNVMTLDELIQSAMNNGVKIVACTMSMDVMGIKKEELIDGVEFAGVASYLSDAEMSNVNLFI